MNLYAHLKECTQLAGPPGEAAQFASHPERSLTKLKEPVETAG